MYHIVYKTINNVNGKYYIGVHKSEKLNDDYLGSGNLLKRSISKYGREKFTRVNMFVFHDKESAYLKEKHVVTEDILNDPMCYNLALGGEGGNRRIGMSEEKLLDYQNNLSVAGKLRYQNEELRNQQRNKMKKYWSEVTEDRKRELSNNASNSFSTERKENLSKRNFENWSDPAFREKMSKIKTGKVWINNGIIQKLVTKPETTSFLNSGFVIGMLKIECEHCKKSISQANFNRWHGDKCRDKQ